MGNKGNKRTTHRLIKLAKYIVLAILMLIFMYPFVWLILTSLKSNNDVYAHPWSLPIPPMFSNYIRALNQVGVGWAMVNSIVISLSASIITLFVGTMAAYKLKRHHTKYSNKFLAFFTIGLVTPVQAILIPNFVTFNKFGLINTRVGLIVIYSAFHISMSILILGSFFETIPKEMEEAAIIDGCGLFRLLSKIILPISNGSIITVLIFTFITNWNELMYATIFLTSSKKLTLPVVLVSFQSQYHIDWSLTLAITTIAFIPGFAIYMIFSKKIMEGMIVGAVKG